MANKFWLLLIPVIGVGLYKLLNKGVGEEVTLTIISTAGGGTSPAAGTHKYPVGEQVYVEPIPNAGYRFDHWSGDIGTANPQQSPLNLLMTENKQVTANFTQVIVPVTVSITIVATTGGVTNPVPGTYEYEEGESITLYAFPSSGYQFVEWVGHLNCPAGGFANPLTCVIGQYDEGKVITAVFSPEQQAGIQLNQGLNSGLTYGGAPGTIAYVMGACLPYVVRIWCWRNGVWLWYDPQNPGPLTNLYTGDLVSVEMSQAMFWTWV